MKDNVMQERQCNARKPDPKLYETNMAEIQVFSGLQIFFGIHVLPETSLYWSDDPILSVQYLRLNNNENFVPHGQPNHDKLFKVHPFLDAVVKNFMWSITPNRICL